MFFPLLALAACSAPGGVPSNPNEPHLLPDSLAEDSMDRVAWSVDLILFIAMSFGGGMALLMAAAQIFLTVRKAENRILACLRIASIRNWEITSVASTFTNICCRPVRGIRHREIGVTRNWTLLIPTFIYGLFRNANTQMRSLRR